MPPVAIAAGVTAAGHIAGGILSNKGASNAAKAQQAAADKAIAYEKEKQAARTARYDAAYADYKNRYDAWVNQYFGGGKPAPAPGGVTGGPAGMAPSGFGQVSKLAPFKQSLVEAAGGFGAPPPQTAVAAPPPLMGQPAAPPQSLAQLGGWEDWRRYIG